MKNLCIFLIVVVQIITIFQWVSCRNFISNAHFSSYDIQLRLTDAIHNDSGITTYETRFYHNKVYAFFADTVSRYIAFWDIRFLAVFLSLIGVLGLVLGFWYGFQTKGKMRYFFLAILIVPFLEIFFSERFPFILRLFLFEAMFCTGTLYGIHRFLRKPRRWKIITVIIVCFVSVWWLFVLRNDVFSFCVKQ